MSEYLALFKQTLRHEADAILRVQSLVQDEQVSSLLELYQRLKETQGMLFFCGVGK